ncbi:hypothetical protein LTR08_003212 [Meristemomyces frigidus]|nr:hypothetical protein LTR08_003212 [Meristemomyces frigidus]
MSTIASPRPSITLSSRRTSTSTDTTTAPSAGAPTHRRNRTNNALRDYYNLQSTLPPSDTASTSSTPPPLEHPPSELDAPHLDPDAYVHALLARQDLAAALKTEARLVAEIRGLDGEKKALVYDNYSKLIAATETIRGMREKMDPLAQTSGLMEDIGAIAERAGQLVGVLEKGGAGAEGERQKRQKKQETVRWVLGAPERLRGFVREGERERAEGEWREVERLLDRWRGVKGCEEVRRACLEALEDTEAG